MSHAASPLYISNQRGETTNSASHFSSGPKGPTAAEEFEAMVNFLEPLQPPVDKNRLIMDQIMDKSQSVDGDIDDVVDDRDEPRDGKEAVFGNN